MKDLSQQYHIVEEAIRQLGVDPVTCRRKTEGQWNLRKGSARVWIDLWYIPSERRSYFQVMSPVVPIPKDNREAFYEYLLQITDKMYGVSTTLYDGWAWMKAIREVEDMSITEAKALLVRVGNYADHYDDILMDAFGLRDVLPHHSSDDRDNVAAPEVPTEAGVSTEDLPGKSDN